MAVTITSIVDVSQYPVWERKIYVTGVNAVSGTPEVILHGLPKAPDEVIVCPNSVQTANNSLFTEIEANRTDTNLSLQSSGTNAASTACIVCRAFNFATLPADGIPPNP